VGGEIYGQGSSREAAVLSPLHLGVRAVLARSFARIHRANLINWGLVPLELERAEDYDAIEQGDLLTLEPLRSALASGAAVGIANGRTGARFTARCALSPREREILLAGGILARTSATTSARTSPGTSARTAAR
jgi:aconitate hydratase